jgi:glycerate 2-kinase
MSRMIITNRDELATTRTREQVLDIIEAGIEQVLPTTIIKSVIRFDSANRTITLSDHDYPLLKGRLFIIGGGKASGLMAEALENVIPPDDITAGVINCKGGTYQTQKIGITTAGHPVPDERGVAGVRQMLGLKQRYAINENDLVICLISGGGSALMPCPVAEINLSDKQKITALLVNSGAEIKEINIVRKHLSQVKGGQLGKYFAPATVVSLILSDVIGNDLATIASGPTYPDPSTFSMAYELLHKYHLLKEAPQRVVDLLHRGSLGEISETPKTLTNCHNYIIGDNGLALEAMKNKASDMGLNPITVTSEQKGDTGEVALSRAKEIIANKYHGYNVILIGGETTIKVPAGAGKGGRNQHYAAVSLLAMKQYPGAWVVASAGTDGSDFLPDVAGAIVDRGSLAEVRTRGLDASDYLKRCDSNTLLAEIGYSLIVTGDTGTNVGDVMVYLLG